MNPLKPVRTVAPDPLKPVLTVAECKQFLHIDHADEDATIEIFRDAAVSYVDGLTGILGRALINQTWRVNLDGWPTCEIRLPFAPISAITTIKYWDGATPSVQQTVTASDYVLLEDHLSPYVKFISSFSGATLAERADAIEILFVAGYGADGTSVPAAIKAAVLLMLGNLYEHREDVVIGETAIMLPQGSEALLAPFRRIFV